MGLAYLVMQLALFSLSRPPSWDEAIYLSQVTPGVPAAAFAPSRARGITLLVAPVTLLGGPIAAVRLFLALVSAVALTAASLLWVPTLGRATALVQLLFGFSWLGLFYGSEVMPNLWVAISAVAVTGILCQRWGEALRARDMALLAGLVGLAATIRPLDAFVLTAVLALGAGIFEPRWHRTIVSLSIGIALGSVVWLGEMSIRLGGPIAALRSATSVGHLRIGSLGNQLLQHLALTDGPALGPQASPNLPLEGFVWWGGIVILGVRGLIRLRDSPTFRPLATVALAGTGLAAVYLLLVSGLAPRFLLPAYALLAVPAAAGLASITADRAVSRTIRAARVVTLALLAGWVIWQVRTAASIEAAAFASRQFPHDVGVAIRSNVGVEGCVLASLSDWPQIAYASRCRGRQLRLGEARQAAELQNLAKTGVRVFVVCRSSLHPICEPSVASQIAAPSGWFAYELRAAVRSEHVRNSRYARTAIEARADAAPTQRSSIA